MEPVIVRSDSPTPQPCECCEVQERTRWLTIRFAIVNTRRTLRLCLILLITGIPPVLWAWAITR